MCTEEEQPNAEQWDVLKKVRERLEVEVELNNEEPRTQTQRRTTQKNNPKAEAMRGVVHGWPVAGKSRVTIWIIRMFKEAMGWQHGVEFVCVAFQNRVAYAMGGATLHTAGGIAFGGFKHDKQLSHGDIDFLFSRNQAIRWILIDEAWQIAGDLL